MLKSTGIVRRIDDLGRVVIPKEIRRTLRVREGDPLEIYTDRDTIVFKKYSPFKCLSDYAKIYVDAIFGTTGFISCITDCDDIITASVNHRYLQDSPISAYLDRIIHDKTSVMITYPDNGISITNDLDIRYHGVICPIISNGDTVGAVMILTTADTTVEPGTAELQMAKMISQILSKHMEE